MFQTRHKTHHSAMAEGNKHILGSRKVVDILQTRNESSEKNSTIYIHVPFCSKICSFCNMRRSLQKPINNYADLIIEEIKAYAELEYVKTSVFDAVYFGGGTPTTLSGEALVSIVKALKDYFIFTSDAEFTVETTVSELSDKKIEELVYAGVNRFSVGVQTFHEEGRKKMNRKGSGVAAYNKLKTLKSYDNVTVSMDLIYNYGGQSMDNLMDDLNKIIELDLDGFSMYSLINMKDASIDEAQNKANDEFMFYTISEHMRTAGYEFLELTKMVKKDGYKYIMNRHQGADTLPLGAGAGGSMNGLAMMNPINLEEYEASTKLFTDKVGMYFSADYKEVVRFKGDIQTTYLPMNTALYKEVDKYEEFLNKLIEDGMVKEVNKRFKLTTKGIFWGNTISRALSDFTN